MKRESDDLRCLFLRCSHWGLKPLGGFGVASPPPPFSGIGSNRFRLKWEKAQFHAWACEAAQASIALDVPKKAALP